MVADVGASRFPTEYRPYFIVSYARSPTIGESLEANPDPLVSKFFRDLEVAVRQYAPPRSGPVYGFYDQQMFLEPEWKESISHALRSAQVFVPLLSVGYYTKMLPGREWACFYDRVAGLPDPLSRFVPVLWTPLAGIQNPPGLQKALALGRDTRWYAKNGLRPMLKIKSYRDSYRAVVNLLAREIVAVAEEFPIRPSEVLDIDTTDSAFTFGTPLAVFAIETATPKARTIAADQDAAWRPFPRQELALTEHASQVVERFDFQATVSPLETVADPRTRRPGIILIDPRFIADQDGRSALESAVSRLPSWVLPLLILDQPDDPRTRDLADQVREILSNAGALPTQSSRRAARGVSSLDEFISIMPGLVVEAERQYLRYRSGQVRSHSPARRPSLRRPWTEEPSSPPDKPASAHDPQGETPDA